MNDPNGPFYDARTGFYHLFYQYNPWGPVWVRTRYLHRRVCLRGGLRARELSGKVVGCLRSHA